jgi:hypothetical protein
MTTLRRPIAVALLAIIALILPACTKSIEGKYVSTQGVLTIVFKSGKATLTGMGETQVHDYTVEGDKITLKDPKEGDVVLTIMKDGTLEGLMTTFKKSAS